jgi:hypothetical protein
MYFLIPQYTHHFKHTNASSVVDGGFEPWSGQTRNYNVGICCFSTTLKRKSKDWLARIQNNASECGDMSIRGLLFQWARHTYTLYTKCVGIVQSGPHHHLIVN